MPDTESVGIMDELSRKEASFRWAIEGPKLEA